MTEVKEKKVRTPKNLDSIVKGALALSLANRVALKNELEKSIDDEIDLLKQQLEYANKIAAK